MLYIHIYLCFLSNFKYQYCTEICSNKKNGANVLKIKIKHTKWTKNTTHNCTGCNLRKAVVNFVSWLSCISKFLLFWCCAGKHLETFLLLWRMISTFLCRDGWIAFSYHYQLSWLFRAVAISKGESAELNLFVAWLGCQLIPSVQWGGGGDWDNRLTDGMQSTQVAGWFESKVLSQTDAKNSRWWTHDVIIVFIARLQCLQSTDR